MRMYSFGKLNQEQSFLIAVFVMSIVVSFLFGYLVFRYEQVVMCKGPIEVVL
jgi:hypothetical protein